ncbi:hypothetical protein ASPZODRAFT_131889 [Penicilliopsis zonata CBS 506.65]|uniref:nicotinamidase n=1 Tax=Penicilliopsis zonata CBS 506.65 TaxID=1073090 RepID=A0A1L9SIR4_9EURO|nr:hypothetical protein ASPZODRAFT_131889 [Penicilliopsis zonata CBS 506.65]OJJ46973.1 hypothetical protein ASPZODRAFT_131889 [Penicilliopsis zonata CBS 506.65]
MQEDFCPPNGSLAVKDGRSITPCINSLLSLPGFVARVATQDYHPVDHISFASNHPVPNNQPFVSVIEMKNPAPGKGAETRLQQLWPAHCIAGTSGASVIPELDTSKIDLYVKKGMHSGVEMYSAFADNFGNLDPTVNAKSVDVDLASHLVEKGVTDVFVVGLAGDYCVKYTAIDAAKAGFKSWVIEEATKCVVPGEGWEKAKHELNDSGVGVIHIDGPELQRVK